MINRSLKFLKVHPRHLIIPFGERSMTNVSYLPLYAVVELEDLEVTELFYFKVNASIFSTGFSLYWVI